MNFETVEFGYFKTPSCKILSLLTRIVNSSLKHARDHDTTFRMKFCDSDPVIDTRCLINIVASQRSDRSSADVTKIKKIVTF